MSSIKSSRNVSPPPAARAEDAAAPAPAGPLPLPPGAERLHHRGVQLSDSFEPVLEGLSEGQSLTVPVFAELVKQVAPLAHPERRALQNAVYEARVQSGLEPGAPPSQFRRVPHQAVVRALGGSRLPSTVAEADTACWALNMEVFRLDDAVRALNLKQPRGPEDAAQLATLQESLRDARQQRTEMRALKSALREVPRKRLLGDTGLAVQVNATVRLPMLLGAQVGLGVDVSPREGLENKRHVEPFVAAGGHAAIWSFNRIRGTHRHSGELQTDLGDITSSENNAIIGNQTSVRMPFTPVGLSVNDRGGLGVLVGVGTPGGLPMSPLPVDELDVQVFLRDPRVEYVSNELQDQVDVLNRHKDRAVQGAKLKLRDLLGPTRYEAVAAAGRLLAPR